MGRLPIGTRVMIRDNVPEHDLMFGIIEGYDMNLPLIRLEHTKRAKK